MRGVVDHDVDRLGVEVWQHMKLTSTNPSIVLKDSFMLSVKYFMKSIDVFI